MKKTTGKAIMTTMCDTESSLTIQYTDSLTLIEIQ